MNANLNESLNNPKNSYRLKVALPNKGSLAEGSINFIRDAGYKVNRGDKELFVYDKKNNIDFFFLRPKDIATYVEAGNFDFGITGKDILENNPKKVQTSLELGYAQSAFYFIAKDIFKFSSFKKDLAGKRIASSYPNIVEKFLKKHKLKANIISLDGAVESSILFGVADFIADVVETGTTLKLAKLKTLGQPILKSQAILIKNPKKMQRHKDFIKSLNNVFLARQYSILEYNIKKENLDKACRSFRGLESPTITTLKGEGWYAVKIMVKNDQLLETMESLNQLGAKGIFVTKIFSCYL